MHEDERVISERAGGGEPGAGINTIDVTAASTDVFALNYSDYAQNNDLLTDIAKLITTGLRPPDLRFNKLKPVDTGKNEYWRYSPQ